MLKAILFDVDDTLLDYHRAETYTFTQMFAEQGVTITQNILDDLWAMSWAYWDQERLSETWDALVQRDYHQRYHRSVRAFVADGSHKHGLTGTDDELYARFSHWMGQAVTLYEDVLPALERLQGTYILCAASNAITDVQEKRVLTLRPYLAENFFSESMGCVKPMPTFFAQACQRLQCQTQDCMMVGDSLTSDIAGAKAAGLRTCWVNRSGRQNDGAIQPDWTVSSLIQLCEKLQTEGEKP